ncbi:hypothetical protein FCV87_11995 [Vibrio breoganii]|nr:hypothetical protein FCV87_11995 [Vibrio breoganii]
MHGILIGAQVYRYHNFDALINTQFSSNLSMNDQVVLSTKVLDFELNQQTQKAMRDDLVITTIRIDTYLVIIVIFISKNIDFTGLATRKMHILKDRVQ